MKNLFTRLRSWLTANRKYEGFVMMEFWTAMLIFTLVVNACRLSHDFFEWLRSFLSFFMVSFNALLWLHDKEKAELHKSYEVLLRSSRESEYAAITDSAIDRGHLMAANRRRKRAERKLKNTRLALRKESAERLGFELQCGEYDAVLLDANLAMADISSCPILPDTKAMAEAQQRFKAYMKIHYAEIAKRQLNRELKKSAFGCLFFGDTIDEVKETYAGLYGSKEFCQQLFADAARDANICLGASLGIKEEESPSTEIKEKQQQ